MAEQSVVKPSLSKTFQICMKKISRSGRRLLRNARIAVSASAVQHRQFQHEVHYAVQKFCTANTGVGSSEYLGRHPYIYRHS